MRTFNLANFLGFLACVASLLIAKFYFQDYLFLNPCPLCYTQRVIIGIIAFWLLFGSFTRSKAWSVLAILTLLGGVVVSARHVWLQNLPLGEAPACGPDFFGIFERFPFIDAVKTALTGSGDCAEVQWSMWGLSIPGWTLVFLVVLFLWLLVFNFFCRRD